MSTNPSRRQVLAWAAAGIAATAAACTRKGHPVASSSPTAAKSTPRSQPSAKSTAPSGPAVEVVHGLRTKDAVALTFHGNGDVALGRQLIQIATDRGAHITVFVVGSWLAANPSVAQLVSDHGHEWANHTWTHPELARLGGAAVLDEIVRCRDALTRVTGTTGKWFRPSAMDRATPLVLTEAGRAGYSTSVAFDVDPSDYRDPGANLVRSRTLAGVQRGSIVSLHLGHQGTVDALPGILDGLSQRGLRPVTVSELLA